MPRFDQTYRRDHTRIRALDAGLDRAVAGLIAQFVPRATVESRAVLHITLCDLIIAANKESR